MRNLGPSGIVEAEAVEARCQIDRRRRHGIGPGEEPSLFELHQDFSCQRGLADQAEVLGVMEERLIKNAVLALAGEKLRGVDENAIATAGNVPDRLLKIGRTAERKAVEVASEAKLLACLLGISLLTEQPSESE